jgi:multiple sugar transport system ATP-binding protein
VFVARFFGTPRINLLQPATLGLEGEGQVGVRAENVAVGVGLLPEGAQEGRVAVVEPMGAETFVTVRVRGERVMARAAADFVVNPGDVVWIRVDPQHLHRFDAAGRAV